MVEIIPYTDNDDDQSNWVPLTAGGGGGGAAASSEESINKNYSDAADNNIVRVNNNTRANATTTTSRSQEDVVFVETVENDSNNNDDDDDDDDDGEWQKLSSPSYQERSSQNLNMATAKTPSTNHNSSSSSSSDPVAQWSWGKQLITHLTSTTTTTTMGTSSTSEQDYDNEENDIEWRRADELMNGNDPMIDRRNNKRSNSFEEEYDDNVVRNVKNIPSVVRDPSQSHSTVSEENNDDKFEPIIHQQVNQEGKKSTLQTQTNNIPKQQKEEQEGAPRKQQAQQPKAQERQHYHHHHQQQHENENVTTSSKVVIKTKLQEKFIHHPIRTIIHIFVRHLYQGIQIQFTLAWKIFFLQQQHQQQQEESGNIQRSYTAPLLSLLLLITSLGMGFIIVGIYGLINSIPQGMITNGLSLLSWVVQYTWRISHQLIWYSIVGTCTLGILYGVIVVIWSRRWRRRGSNDEDDIISFMFQVPSISSVIPWVVAFTSQSMYEVFIIVFSLQTVMMSVLRVTTYHGIKKEGQCILASSFDNDEEDLLTSCLAEDGVVVNEPIVAGVYTALAACIVALLVAVLNVTIVVSVAENFISDENDKTLMMNPPCDAARKKEKVTSWNHYLCKCLDWIQPQHIPIYHTISIFTLAGLSITIRIIEMLYVSYLEGGGKNMIFSLLNAMGSVGRNTMYIAIGVFILVTLWKNTIMSSSILTGDTVGRFISGISFGDISKVAMRDTMMEISSSSELLWDKDGAWNGILGILTDDDCELRMAILEWAVDRWTASRPSTVGTASSSSGEEAAATVHSASVNTQQSSHDFSSTTASAGTSNCHAGSSGFPVGPDPNSRNSKGYNDSSSTNNSHRQKQQATLPSYQSLQNVIIKLDADETLIPTIERYRTWVYSLPPSQNAAVCVALWKMCPATAVLAFTVLYYIVLSAVKRLSFCLLWTVGRSSSTTQTVTMSGWPTFFTCMIIMLSPLLFLEYHRVSQWWTKALSQTKDAESDAVQSLTLLRADATAQVNSQQWPATIMGVYVMDLSCLLMRIWNILLESITVLESSIPVVRCATVACTAAELTSNTICIVDLALEVKKRGLIGGIGMMLLDAFQYTLSRELKQRRENQDTGNNNASSSNNKDQAHDREDLGGQYTGSLVGAVENIGKMSHNISCLMDSGNEENVEQSPDICDDEDAETKFNEVTPCSNNQEVSGDDVEDKNSSECVNSNLLSEDQIEDKDKKCDTDCSKDIPCVDSGNSAEWAPIHCSKNECLQNENNQDAQILSSLEKSEEKEENTDGGLMPFLVGGGLAVIGAFAGIAIHNANSCEKRDDDRREKSSKRY